MDEIKIKHFKRDYPDRNFPFYVSLSIEQMKKIRTDLCERIGYISISDNLELLKTVYRFAYKIDFNAFDEDFELKRVFNSIGIRQEETVFIDWYRFDDIDEIGLNDLNEFLEDIWYPGAEDLSIFDSTISWILFISHNGDIYFVDFLKLKK